MHLMLGEMKVSKIDDLVPKDLRGSQPLLYDLDFGIVVDSGSWIFLLL